MTGPSFSQIDEQGQMRAFARKGHGLDFGKAGLCAFHGGSIGKEQVELRRRETALKAAIDFGQVGHSETDQIGSF